MRYFLLRVNVQVTIVTPAGCREANNELWEFIGKVCFLLYKKDN